ncbi:MAG: M48 family metallopeptidase [Anaerolineae bacterium]|nr:M48 family metallopeptidase [Anaerolineae bacterium]
MTLHVQVRQQARKSLALRITPDGLIALVPQHLDPDGQVVQDFIQRGLARLPEPIPPAEPLTLDALHTLVETWANRIGVTVHRVQIRTMRTKWASCSSRGTLTLNRDLLTLPHELVDYVVCHELVHRKIPEHGKGWQALMGIYLPDWRERERRLAG